MKKQLAKWIVTLGPIGYLPASGTWATLLTALFLICVKSWLTFFNYTFFFVLFLIGSYILLSQSIGDFKDHDPSEIVIDEVIGCLFVFWAIPISWQSILCGVLLFRIFDILKIGPIKCAECYTGAWGILFDDLLAGLLANLLLQFFFT